MPVKHYFTFFFGSEAKQKKNKIDIELKKKKSSLIFLEASTENLYSFFYKYKNNKKNYEKKKKYIDFFVFIYSNTHLKINRE